MPAPASTPPSGYAGVNGINLYYEIHGAGAPLVLLHGGLMATGLLGELLPTLAADRQVIAADLQGHGRTADIDRPLRFESMADDVAALIEHLKLDRVALMGYSLGGGTALQTAIRHPDLVNKLVVVSAPFTRAGWHAEALAGMEHFGSAAFEMLRQSPPYQHYASVAPRPDDFPTLLDKLGDLMRQDYDWSAGVAALPMPTLLVFGDADSVGVAHVAEFYALLGGGQRDAGWDYSGAPRNRLAILPATHYDIIDSSLLAPLVTPFLDGTLPGAG
jgi:pimeloyl-ACP methyl ester carboxylesterase